MEARQCWSMQFRIQMHRSNDKSNNMCWRPVDAVAHMFAGRLMSIYMERWPGRTHAVHDVRSQTRESFNTVGQLSSGVVFTHMSHTHTHTRPRICNLYTYIVHGGVNCNLAMNYSSLPRHVFSEWFGENLSQRDVELKSVIWKYAMHWIPPHYTHFVNAVYFADAAHLLPSSVVCCSLEEKKTIFFLSRRQRSQYRRTWCEGALQMRIKVNQVKDETTNEIGAMSEGDKIHFIHTFFFCVNT